MAYLDLRSNEDDVLCGVVDATEGHRARMNTDLFDEFIEEAESITSLNDSSGVQVRCWEPHPGGPQATIRLRGFVRQKEGAIQIPATTSQLPEDVCQAEGIVRALIMELQDRGCTNFEAWGRPGRAAGVDATMSPNQE